MCIQAYPEAKELKLDCKNRFERNIFPFINTEVFASLYLAALHAELSPSSLKKWKVKPCWWHNRDIRLQRHNIIYNHWQLIEPLVIFFFNTKALYLFFEASLEERRAVISLKRERVSQLCMQMRKPARKHGQINWKHLATEQLIVSPEPRQRPSTLLIPARKNYPEWNHTASYSQIILINKIQNHGNGISRWLLCKVA